jgi:1-acyl-sn-glycerol-3-phosphate acyltransferase
MGKWIAAARMIFVCTFLVLYLIVVGIPVLTYCRLISNPALALRLTKLLDRILLFLAGMRLEVIGVEKVPRGRGVVYVGNHRSHTDPAALLLTLPGDLRFLAKKELFRIPLVSFALRTMGMIEVDRSNPEAAADSIDRAVREIREGKSIILFPEGTRSREKSLLPFKKGAFVLAIKANAPIVPVTLIGTDQVLKPDGILLYPGKVQVLIHDPIYTEGLNLEDRDELLEKARRPILATFPSQ